MGRSLLVGLVFFAIFVAGIMTGGLFTARWVKNNHAWRQKNNQQQVGVPPIVPMVMRQMLNQLDLTRDQRKAANKTLLESADTLRVLHREADFALDRMQDDIDKILTPDQRDKLGKLKDEQRAKLQEQREAVHHFLEQRRNDEAAQAAPNAQPVPSVGAATPSQLAPASVTTQTQPAPAH
jgi:Spy/CpxP family protein refolding chaperone